MKMYSPPFSITNEMVSLISEKSKRLRMPTPHMSR